LKDCRRASKEKKLQKHASWQSKRLKLLLRECSKRGIEFKATPGLERHTSNTSFYHQRNDSIQWKVEWLLDEKVQACLQINKKLLKDSSITGESTLKDAFLRC
jgi:hypothetical protein